MPYSPEEIAQRQRFDEFYLRSQSPVLLSIERTVCGCGYGGNSWTTRDEADRFGAILGLEPGLRLLDLGAGAGWPGLYLAQQSGCDVVLLDLPITGLRIASERAAKDRISSACLGTVADAAALPFSASTFDAVSHSDLLCCLQQKGAVLRACRQVVRDQGRMVFTVISIAPGLTPDDHRRAVENGPEYIDSESSYPTLLAQTGWVIAEQHDITEDYARSCERQRLADQKWQQPLEELIGVSAYAERWSGWMTKIVALADGLIRRELFVVIPDSK